ncbi:unnamed protein product, partial [Mesorhabditis belari]|uniref:Uncharacterized protein n=1 Tax=Mesorhabditis belari TaxID=2138241 RepID=A0AAF3JAM7_9BILA
MDLTGLHTIEAMCRRSDLKVKGQLMQRCPQFFEKVTLLEKMLERVNNSTNTSLKQDIQRHGILEKLNSLATLLTTKHHHTWTPVQIVGDVYLQAPGGITIISISL